MLAVGNDQVDQLNDEEQEYIREGYDSMPDWKSKGDIRFQRPTPWIAGTIDIELFPEVAPKAAENFRCLVTGGSLCYGSFTAIDSKVSTHPNRCK